VAARAARDYPEKSLTVSLSDSSAYLSSIDPFDYDQRDSNRGQDPEKVFDITLGVVAGIACLTAVFSGVLKLFRIYKKFQQETNEDHVAGSVVVSEGANEDHLASDVVISEDAM